jgi:hypothetical protein
MAELDQYFPGGMAQQMAAGVTGMTGPYDQYHPGGAVGQISQAAGFGGAYDQCGTGHPVEQFITATGVVPPAGPTRTARDGRP